MTVLRVYKSLQFVKNGFCCERNTVPTPRHATPVHVPPPPAVTLASQPRLSKPDRKPLSDLYRNPDFGQKKTTRLGWSGGMALCATPRTRVHILPYSSYATSQFFGPSIRFGTGQSALGTFVSERNAPPPHVRHVFARINIVPIGDDDCQRKITAIAASKCRYRLTFPRAALHSVPLIHFPQYAGYTVHFLSLYVHFLSLSCAAGTM